MPLLTLFPWLGLITGRVWVYLALGAMVGSFAGGYWVKGRFDDAKQVRAVNEARAKERAGVLIGNDAEANYLNRLREEKGKSDEEVADLRERLKKAPACRVPVSRGMRQPERVSGIAAPASSAGAAAPSVDTADARDVSLNLERNRVEVSNPNAEQLAAMQRFYNELRQRFNGR